MSGPKAFHVVTREELMARSEAHLRRLDAAITEWKNACERAEVVDAKVAEAVEARRRELRRMHKEDRFGEIQRQVPAEISFLRADAHTRVERAAAAATQAMHNRRRTARTARMLLEAIRKSGREIPAALQRDLESSDPTESAIASAFAFLSPTDSSGHATDRQRELAAQLGRDEKRVTLAEWLAAQPPAAEEEPDLRIDQHLAELRMLGVDPTPFAARATAIESELPSRKAMLMDSLLVELARAVREGRERSAHLADLRERAAVLAHYDSAPAQELRGRIEAAILAEDVSSATSLTAEVDDIIQGELRTLAADARRRALLQALASLGYEVNDGMATAWIQNGNVVLRKAANPDYGVELGGGTRSDRLQIRAVAFGTAQSPRNASRDSDMEAIWCSEFERLRSLLSAAGGNLGIEHALPVGATPLKVIDDPKTREQIEEIGTHKMLRP